MLDLTAELRATEFTAGKTGDTKLIGYLPGVVIEHWCKLNNVSWQEFCREPKYVKRLLNDPDFKYFRTTNGSF